MNLFGSPLIFLCAFRVIRYGRGLSIEGPADKNITTGMTVPIECHSDQNGIAFEFSNRSSTQSVPIAECQFKTNDSYFMHGGFKSAYSITQRSRTCILTILCLIENQCGTYSCKQLFSTGPYVYWNMSCNGTTNVTCTPGVTTVQPDTRRTRIIIGSILGVVAFISIFLAYCKWRNTIHMSETGTTTHESQAFIPQKTGREESDSAPVSSGNSHVVDTKHEMIDDSNNRPSEEICENGTDAMERVGEAQDNSKALISDQNSISLNHLVAGPNASPGKDDRNPDTDNVPESALKEESADPAEEEQINLHNPKMIAIIRDLRMAQSIKEELQGVATSGSFKMAKDKFDTLGKRY